MSTDNTVRYTQRGFWMAGFIFNLLAIFIIKPSFHRLLHTYNRPSLHLNYTVHRYKVNSSLDNKYIGRYPIPKEEGGVCSCTKSKTCSVVH